MSAEEKKNPPLAGLVNAGQQQSEAVAITDYIFMAKDISNAYLVTTSDGDLLVNAGFPTSAERNKAVLAPARTGPLRYIVLTQSHPDHFGGVPALKEPDTKVVVERRYVETAAWYEKLRPHGEPRSRKLWGGTVNTGGPPLEVPVISPDIEVDREYAFELGERRFEVISTPGGETLDSLTVWMPNEKVAFTGNLFGPVFLSMPFLNTIRGDKPRLVVRYLKSLDRVRQLGAEILITGHGDPIVGAEKIRADLDKMYAAVSYINEATIAGMNAGKDVFTLMREIRLPDHLKIGEFHGNVRWAVRAIYHEYTGWFLYDSTTSLYGVPRSSVDKDLVELAGGAQILAGRAREKLNGGAPLEALHLLDVALGAEPSNSDALAVKKDALQRLLTESGGANLSETMWLKSEIAAAEAALSPNGAGAA
ncbi:MBL fold metallo-hydrolase [Phenylobacterium sp. LjRoot219]|uniref:MBL fold metallo-hydrolase n=1 Tax=Phenylobacterium sp. LjRoot219 TaxID=3342283 RepID=UPI003ECF87A0